MQSGLMNDSNRNRDYRPCSRAITIQGITGIGLQVLDFCIDRLLQVGIDFTDEHAKYIIEHFVDE